MVTVKELLQPIFHRLHDIESQNVSLYDSDYLKKAELNLFMVKRDLFSVDKVSVITDLQMLLNKVEQLQSNHIDYTKNFNDEFGIGNTAEVVNAIVAKELSLYKSKIYSFLKELNVDSDISVTTIQLPENFDAIHFKKAGFSPLLTSREATLLLYLLKENKFLPPYTNDNLSSLALILFGRGKQGVRENLGTLLAEIQDDNTIKSLKSLRDKIQSLLEALNLLLNDNQ